MDKAGPATVNKAHILKKQASSLSQLPDDVVDPLRAIITKLGPVPAQLKKEDDRMVILYLDEVRIKHLMGGKKNHQWRPVVEQRCGGCFCTRFHRFADNCSLNRTVAQWHCA